MANDLLAMLMHVLSDPARLAKAVEARDAAAKFQASQSRWQAAADRAAAHRREHPEQPLPSELAGALSEAIAEAEGLEQTVIGAFGDVMPEASKSGFQGMRVSIAALREILKPSQN
jgi:hypothetical protein